MRSAEASLDMTETPRLRVVALDIDGVLTDGHVNLTESGQEAIAHRSQFFLGRGN